MASTVGQVRSRSSSQSRSVDVASSLGSSSTSDDARPSCPAYKGGEKLKSVGSDIARAEKILELLERETFLRHDI